ncbi:MAG: outer membrane beta-barrel protein, partial [Candidatus Omnitrophica bacterium]|nr:outer membrane beta-barrel protein [Candidatus Omnitrophota bacterium]
QIMKSAKILLLSVAAVIFCNSYALAGIFATQTISQDFQPEGIVLGKDLTKENSVSVGQARFKTAVTVSETFDDNIFLTPSDKKSDYITELNPQIFMDLPFGIDERHNFQVLYDVQLGSYADHNSQNYQDQALTSLLNFKLPFGYFAIRDFFNKTSSRAGTEFTNLIRRTDNQADALLGIEFNKLANEFNYTHFTRHFNSRDYTPYNYTEDVGTSTTYYQLFPKTKALFEYNYGNIDYTSDNSRDGYFNQYRFGFKGDLTGKTIGIIKVGYQDRKYNDDSEQGWSHFVAEFGLMSQLSDRTKLTLRFIDTAIESVYDNNNYYNNNSLVIELNQGLAGHLSLNALFGVDRNLYPEVGTIVDKKRKDTILTGGLGLEYQVKDWVKAGLNYQYREDISNIDPQDYNQNQVMASITFMI